MLQEFQRASPSLPIDGAMTLPWTPPPPPGLEEARAGLFRTLEGMADPAERVRHLDDWLSERFHLRRTRFPGTGHDSYLRYLRCWGHDASSAEGAVLKAWVESRLGIAPTFHRTRLDADLGEARLQYERDRELGTSRGEAVFDQLDVLYAFTQYELRRRAPGVGALRLWRGQHDADAHEVVARSGPRELTVRLNNLCSFTDDPEVAWEFGSTVWEANVPIARIFFASWLIGGALQGEREALVIGGVLTVKRVLG
jgi:NAD+--dinitrogen-reductase ADP-D-ribosyltransferase